MILCADHLLILFKLQTGTGHMVNDGNAPSVIGRLGNIIMNLKFEGQTVTTKGKAKGKRGFVYRLVMITSLRRSDMAERSQGISQFYLHTPHSSANGMNHTMNHTCLCLPSRSWYSQGK